MFVLQNTKKQQQTTKVNVEVFIIIFTALKSNLY